MEENRELEKVNARHAIALSESQASVKAEQQVCDGIVTRESIGWRFTHAPGLGCYCHSQTLSRARTAFKAHAESVAYVTRRLAGFIESLQVGA